MKAYLAAYLAKWPARPITLPWRDHAEGRPTTVRLMATTRERTVINRSYFNARIWKPALREAGVPVTRPNGTHALRHFYASALLDGGESIRAVSEYLGHADPGFTLRTYTHLMLSSAERTRRAIDAVLIRCRNSLGATGSEQVSKAAAHRACHTDVTPRGPGAAAATGTPCGIGSQPSPPAGVAREVILSPMLGLALLLLLLLGLAVGVAALAGVGRMVGGATLAQAEDQQDHRWRRLAAVLVGSSVVGLAVWMSEFVRDPVVLVDGERTTCAAGIGEDLPSRVAEQCDAQRDDRSMQARVAGLTAAVASAIALWGASGRPRRTRVSATRGAISHDP